MPTFRMKKLKVTSWINLVPGEPHISISVPGLGSHYCQTLTLEKFLEMAAKSPPCSQSATDAVVIREVNVCVPKPIGCGEEVGTFKDNLSMREWQISGLCQKCQDGFFDELPEAEQERREADATEQLAEGTN